MSWFSFYVINGCNEMLCNNKEYPNASVGRKFVKEEGKKMEQTYYLISDAAKQVQVESHVLRYWEEELKLPIKRNELGHRFYTEEDIARFISIKRLKEKGLQLKAIKLVLQDEESFEQELLGESETKKEQGREQNKNHMQEESRKENIGKAEMEKGNYRESMRQNLKGEALEEAKGKKIISVISKANVDTSDKADKVLRMQILLRQMISEAVRSSNEELCENLRDSIVKELDYQFRTLEEKEEERAGIRDKKDEEHYQKVDELLRGCLKPKKEKKEKKRKLFRAEKA